jgi:Tfp pilus assembly protein PilW
MSQRGSSLVEVLAAAAITAVVAMGLAGFFLAMLRLGKDMDAQAALQRQGSAIAEELGRRLRVAGASTLVDDPADDPATWVCLPLATNDTVLVITSAGPSVTCLYRDTSSPPQVVRCTRPTPADPCAPVANLLSGSLAPLSATAWSVSLVTPCSAAFGTCTGSLCSLPNESCDPPLGAKVVFTLSDGVNSPETFGVTTVPKGGRHN